MWLTVGAGASASARRLRRSLGEFMARCNTGSASGFCKAGPAMVRWLTVGLAAKLRDFRGCGFRAWRSVAEIAVDRSAVAISELPKPARTRRTPSSAQGNRYVVQFKCEIRVGICFGIAWTEPVSRRWPWPGRRQAGHRVDETIGAGEVAWHVTLTLSGSWGSNSTRWMLCPLAVSLSAAWSISPVRSAATSS